MTDTRPKPMATGALYHGKVQIRGNGSITRGQFVAEFIPTDGSAESIPPAWTWEWNLFDGWSHQGIVALAGFSVLVPELPHLEGEWASVDNPAGDLDCNLAERPGFARAFLTRAAEPLVHAGHSENIKALSMSPSIYSKEIVTLPQAIASWNDTMQALKEGLIQ